MDKPTDEHLKQGYERLDPPPKDERNNTAQLFGKKIETLRRPLPKQSD